MFHSGETFGNSERGAGLEGPKVGSQRCLMQISENGLWMRTGQPPTPQLGSYSEESMLFVSAWHLN